MLFLYLFSKFLQKKDDYQFSQYWEHKFLPKVRYYLFGLILYFAFAVGILVEILLWGNESFLFAILVFTMVVIVYGSFLLRYVLQFFGKHNRRFILYRSGFQEDTFDKSNVII